MRTIQKGKEPPSLTNHRKKDYADYNNYPDKDNLRRALVEEQHGLCCYCQSRIRPTPTAMKIEHWMCQENYPDRQLDYINLHGACLGGKGRRPESQHCDTRKGEKLLSFSVCDSSHRIEERIRFLGDGTIKSDNATIDKCINETLNLNLQLLKDNRKAALDGFIRATSSWGLNDLKKALGRWDASQPGDLEPFSQIVVHYLNKRIARASR